MFTGIIESLGKVKLIKKTLKNEIYLGISPQNADSFKDVKIGESISVNGVCLTVAEMNDFNLTFYLSPETLDRTQFKNLKNDVHVNLERALKLSDRLSGHIVQGHVDGTGLLHKIENIAESILLEVSISDSLTKYCIEKGSICINGVSLTVNSIINNHIQLMIIPHTWKHTQFNEISVGDLVNIEVDVLAKYMEKLCQK